MMAINIAAMDAAQKLEYAQATGSVLLASGSISSPTVTVELALPTAYKSFTLELRGMQADGADQFCYRLSFDGGTTYSDESNYKMSRIYEAFSVTAPDPLNTVALSNYSDTMGYLIFRIDGDPATSSSDTIIHPGSASTYATVNADTNFRDNSFGGGAGKNIWEYFTEAYEEVGRATHIQLGVYFGDGLNWTNGSYYLFGEA
jgi:hypothetical protein